MIGGNYGKRRRWPQGEQFSGKLQAVSPGHIEVQQGNVERAFFGQRERLIGV
jgi:hypothetical protein